MSAPVVHRSIRSGRRSFPRLSQRLGRSGRKDAIEHRRPHEPNAEDPEVTTVIIIGGHPQDLGIVASEMRRHPIKITTSRHL